MDKQETQVEPGTPQEQAVTEPTASPVPDVEKLTQEVERKEAEIKRLQGILKKQGVSKDEMSALQQEIVGMREEVAGWMDDLYGRVSGEENEPKPRKSYRQQLDEKQKSKPKVEPDPDIQKFIGYINSQGLDYDDPLVQEAVANERSPQEALKYLKGKVETKMQTAIDKRAEEIAETIATTLVEQKLRDLGLTVSGAGAPSGASGRTWSKKQLDAMPLEEYQANKEAIAEALRQGRIRD